MRDSGSEERAVSGVSLLILAFHALEERGDVLSFPPSLLPHAIQILLDAGCQPVTVVEGAQHLRDKSHAPGRLFALTFDDAYRSVYEHALPLLLRLRLPATLFINGLPEKGGALPSMEGRTRMTAAQILEWANAGCEVGAHSMTHPDLTRLDDASLHHELSASRAGLEALTGNPVTTFAYPFGFHDARTRAAARRHFQCACSTAQGVARSTADPFALPRIEMADFRSAARLRLLASPWLPAWLGLLAGPRWLSQQRLRRNVRRQIGDGA